jgi:hypothetical protein
LLLPRDIISAPADPKPLDQPLCVRSRTTDARNTGDQPMLRQSVSPNLTGLGSTMLLLLSAS